MVEATIKYRDLDKRWNSENPNGIYQIEQAEFLALPRTGERIKHHKFNAVLKVISVTHAINVDGIKEIILLCMHDD